MLLWVTVIAFVVFTIMFGLCLYMDHDNLAAFTFTFTIAFFLLIAVIAMSVIAIASNVGVDAYVAEQEQVYESLLYQYENDIYDNDNDIGKKELMDNIQDWNTSLAYHKEVQDDLWLGIFHANIYDQFNFIELNWEDIN